MIKKFLAASLILFLFAPINAKALELLAIVVDWCPYCQRFESSLVPEYTGDVPLVVVNVTDGQSLPQWFKTAYDAEQIQTLYSVPTFIIWDEVNNRELVRWVSYQDPTSFYQMLTTAIEKAKEVQKDCEEVNACTPINLNY